MRYRILYILGIVLTIVGSFLPWELEGDVIPYWKNGISLYLDDIQYWLRGLHTSPINDNGGLLVIGLSVVIFILVFRTPKFIKQPFFWKLICASCLVIIMSYHVSILLLRGSESYGVVGAPSIEIGLIMVTFGSLLLLIAGVSDYISIRRDST
jgi:hypothetical protein